jgi:hypothetical protein
MRRAGRRVDIYYVHTAVYTGEAPAECAGSTASTPEDGMGATGPGEGEGEGGQSVDTPNRGHPLMTMTHTVAKALTMDGADLVAFAKSGSLSKAELYDTIDRIAQRGRRDGESTQQAFARYATLDPIGKQLLNEHMRKRGVPYASPAAVAKVVPDPALVQLRKLLKMNVDDSDAVGDRPAERLSAMADAYMMANPGCTKTKAFDAVMRTAEGKRLMERDKARTRRAAY